MAIDTKSISQLITEFRALQTKDSITPESLGYILQRLADLLATAGTSETVDKIQKLLDGFKTAAYAITNIQPLSEDRNHVYANVGKVNLVDGTVSTERVEFIHQATTERAGAMRAQQVTDLNAARNNVAALQKQTAAIENILAEMQKILGIGDGTAVTSVVNTAQISCEIVGGRLKVHGAQKLVSAGYVPYLFRFTRKRNQYHHRAKYRTEQDANKRYCQPSKGWHVYGSVHTVKISGEDVSFTTIGRFNMSVESENYSPDVMSLVHIHTRDDGSQTIGWGRSMVDLLDKKATTTKKKKYRMLRFRYAIGFAKAISPGTARITPANLVSSLAEFSVIFDPQGQVWRFGK